MVGHSAVLKGDHSVGRLADKTVHRWADSSAAEKAVRWADHSADYLVVQ